jgi:hypothetical protein
MLKKTVAAIGIAALAGAGAIDVLPTAAKAATGVQIAAACKAKCNPCAGKKACNPCAAKKGCNPCAAKKACNPCAAKKACNPCAAKKK